MTNIKLAHIIGVLIVMIIVHFLAIATGLYETTYVWIDEPLHLLGGVVGGLAGGWLYQRWQQPMLSRRAYVTAITLFALTGAFLWEIYEFLVWTLAPTSANLFKFYSPTIEDLLSDMTLGVIGGIIIGLYLTRGQNAAN